MPALSQRRSTSPDAFDRLSAFSCAAVLLASLVLASPAQAQQLAPLAAVDGSRMAVKTGFKRFVALLNAGDPRSAEYLTADFTIDAPDAPEFAAMLRAPTAHHCALVPYEILLDDDGERLAVELEARDVGKARCRGKTPVHRTVFYALREGKLASGRVALDAAQLFPRDREVVSGDMKPHVAMGALPVTVAQPYMTRAKFEDYLQLFGRFDERFVLYYHPEIVFGIAPATSPLHGREEILALYRPLRRTLDEDIAINSLVIDSERGVMAAEITNTMTATGPVQLLTLRMEAGDRRVGSGVIFYGLKDGMIVNLRETS